jgi:capsular exopolysaccharide synthesis family protein
MKAQGIKFVLDQNTLDDSKLRQLQASLATMQSDRIEKESRYNLAKSNPSDSLPEILDDATITGLKTHLTQLRQERAVLLATLTPEHYKVRRVDAEIAETDASIRSQKANVVKRIQNEYEAALERERRTAAAYQSQSHVLANQSDESLQYEALKQGVASARSYYNQILSQYNTALRVSAVPVENVRLIDPAQPFNVPQSPKPLTDVIGGTVVGFGLAVLLVLGFEQLRYLRVSRTFHAPGHASALLEVPELGVIPRLDIGNRKKPLLLTDGSEKSTSIAPGPSRLASWESEPFVAEPFRLVVASLFARKLDRGHTAILISSAAPEEGKTTVASHTAVVMAQAGRRVLLVDADVRRPRLYKLFSLPKERGFGELLAGETPVTPNTLADRIIQSPIRGLSLLPAGIVSDEAIGRIFFSDGLQAAVDHLRHMFDIVIIDSAPALSFSDARRIGRVCDGVILVLRAEKTSRESARATAASLLGDGIPVLGAVLNDFMPDQTSPYTDVYTTYRKYAAARDGEA